MCHHASKCEMDALLSINYYIILYYYFIFNEVSKCIVVVGFIHSFTHLFIHSFIFMPVRVLLFEYGCAYKCRFLLKWRGFVAQLFNNIIATAVVYWCLCVHACVSKCVSVRMYFSFIIFIIINLTMCFIQFLDTLFLFMVENLFYTHSNHGNKSTREYVSCMYVCIQLILAVSFFFFRFCVFSVCCCCKS